MGDLLEKARDLRFGLADPLGQLRYGMSTADKEAAAGRHDLPNAPKDQEYENDERTQRHAAGYYFTKRYPNAAPILMPAINFLKTSSAPIFGGDSADLQSYAQDGMNQALREYANANRAQPTGNVQAAALRTR